MEADVTEWLNLAARWVHIFAGILWIGQTYFFTWMDGRFSELEKSGSGKTIWMVHSGGFYVVEKQLAPAIMPKLHWFRWEAAIAWLSGILLLLVVYYHGGLLVDETMNETIAMIAGIGVILLSWPAYELLWRSFLGKNELLGAAVSFLLIVLVAYGLTDYMGARAAYIHVGAMLGTIMTANVWNTIIPAQRKMVASLHAGQKPDAELARRAKTCSRHNTFMVMPVVFLMISNHFPTATYGSTYNWLVLALLVLVGWVAAFIVRRA